MQSAWRWSSGIDVEALLEDLHPVLVLAVGVDAELRHPGQERIFVAEEPDAQRAVLESAGAVMPVSAQQVSCMPERLKAGRC
jgi:hypothetical protein